MTRIGIHFPQAEVGSDPHIIRDFLQMSEDLGFSHVNVPDHVVQTRTPVPDFPPSARYTTRFPHHEPFALIAFGAAVTSRIVFKTAVLILPQRQASLVAKQAAEVDVLSGGRFALGVGIGWNVAEYDALNVRFADRAQRLEEQVEVCRLLWTQPHVTYHGRWHHIRDAGLSPMPIQRPVPIWIGAFVEPAIKRAARLADGWQSQFEAPDETAKRAYQAFRDEVQRVGRNPADVGIEATCFARGTDPTAWTRLVEDYLACGATQLVFRPEGTFSQIADAMQRFAPFVADLTRR